MKTGADSPWLTTHEAAVYLRYTGKHALRSLYRFIKAKGIPKRYKSPRAILIAKADLDRALDGHAPKLKLQKAS